MSGRADGARKRSKRSTRTWRPSCPLYSAAMKRRAHFRLQRRRPWASTRRARRRWRQHDGGHRHRQYPARRDHRQFRDKRHHLCLRTGPRGRSRGEIAAFCDSTNRWLPLLCTMNVTVATEMVRNDFGMTHEAFEKTQQAAPAGSDGLLLLLLPRRRTHTQRPVRHGRFRRCPAHVQRPHFARAAIEGVTFDELRFAAPLPSSA